MKEMTWTEACNERVNALVHEIIAVKDGGETCEDCVNYTCYHCFDISKCEGYFDTDKCLSGKRVAIRLARQELFNEEKKISKIKTKLKDFDDQVKEQRRIIKYELKKNTENAIPILVEILKKLVKYKE